MANSLKQFFTVLWLLAFALCASAAEPDLLDPDQAFRFSARVLGEDAIEVRYQVAPGYYLYRDKFQFRAQPATIELGKAELPPGELKKDEFFGETQTYRGEVRIRLPIRAAGAREATVVATSQGCADAGVCYVPSNRPTSAAVCCRNGIQLPGSDRQPRYHRPHAQAR